MKKTIAFVMLLCIWGAVGNAQDYNYENIPVTRWADPDTRPGTYEEYVAGHTFDESMDAKLFHVSDALEDGYIVLVVNGNIIWDIWDELQVYMQDLEQDGYGVIGYSALNDNNPEGLRELLKDDWTSYDVVGAVLIGDLSIPWYEMNEPESWGGAHVEFPCDLYYMDLDGDWQDQDQDGKYDEHTGTLEADIWVGHIFAYQLSMHGADEAALINAYLQRNHRYRTGEERLDDKAIAFIDDDWCVYGWENIMYAAYDVVDAFIDPDTTTAPRYRLAMAEEYDNRYEHLLLCAHSSPDLHQFTSWGYSYFYCSEIEELHMQAHFYNLFACSNSRYSEDDYMGGWYVMQTRYGLLSIGTTKTGSMLVFEDYYEPLGWGYSFGEAFKFWAENNMEYGAGSDSRAWFYGMTIIGDPTLKVQSWMPSTEIVLAAQVPGKFSVNQNYPNPFNASTLITYVLPSDGRVRIELFDLLGRKVDTIFEGRQRAGRNAITYRADDLAAGVYIYRISSGEYSASRLMTLMK